VTHRSLVAARRLALILLGSLLLAPAARAQGWSWPDSSKNLKVLPKNTNRQQLSSAMVGFAGALGVRCAFCHEGDASKPLSTFDFPSDKNPKKDVARGMIKMVNNINDQLAQIRPDDPNRITVGCYTCHRGVSKPRTLSDELIGTYDTADVDSTLARYQTMRARYTDAGAYDFRDWTLNALGDHVLEKKDVQGALKVFRLNLERFPQSSLAHAGLGKVQLAAGDTTAALAEYQRALELDPENRQAKRAIDTLRGH
jgi:tetratricopeptide (TPR) repeat protein